MQRTSPLPTAPPGQRAPSRRFASADPTATTSAVPKPAAAPSGPQANSWNAVPATAINPHASSGMTRARRSQTTDTAMADAQMPSIAAAGTLGTMAAATANAVPRAAAQSMRDRGRGSNE